MRDGFNVAVPKAMRAGPWWTALDREDIAPMFTPGDGAVRIERQPVGYEQGEEAGAVPGRAGGEPPSVPVPRRDIRSRSGVQPLPGVAGSHPGNPPATPGPTPISYSRTRGRA